MRVSLMGRNLRYRLATEVERIGEKAGAMVCSPGQADDTVEWVESERAHAALLRALLTSIVAQRPRQIPPAPLPDSGGQPPAPGAAA